MNDIELRNEIIATVLKFDKTGLSEGTSGNLSARTNEGFLITPSGVVYEKLLPDDLVEMDLTGRIINGKLKPSSEWPFHRAIYATREETRAIVHVHSPYATGIACTRKDIPAFHYMVALAGGENIRCAEYATFGSEELSVNAVKALQARKACLLANHGQVALGKDIPAAFGLAREVENLARLYWISLQAGGPALLDEQEMKVNLEKFMTYGKQD